MKDADSCKRTLSCRCSVETTFQIEFHLSSSVAAMKAQTGWQPLVNGVGGMSWMCPACTEKARPHVRALLDLAGRDVWHSLAFLEKE